MSCTLQLCSVLSFEDEERLAGEHLELYIKKESEDWYAAYAHDVAAHYMEHRLTVVHWLREVMDSVKAYNTTLAFHYAVTYLDRLAGLVVMRLDSIQLWAMTCAIIALKFSEPETRYPLNVITYVNDITGNLYDDHMVAQAERVALDSLRWDLAMALPDDHLSLALRVGLPATEDEINNPAMLGLKTDVAELSAHMVEYVYETMSPSPCEAGWAAVAAARYVLGIIPEWTSIMGIDITSARDSILRTYERERNRHELRIITPVITPAASSASSEKQEDVSPRRVTDACFF